MKRKMKPIKPSVSLYGVFSTIGQAKRKLPSGAKSSAMMGPGIPKMPLKRYKGKKQKKLEGMKYPFNSLFKRY